MPLQILTDKCSAGGFRRDAARLLGLLRKCACRQFEAPRSPRGGFLFGAEMRDNQKALQLIYSSLETHVSGLAVHFAGVAQFQRGERAKLCQRFPNSAGIVRDSSGG